MAQILAKPAGLLRKPLQTVKKMGYFSYKVKII